MRLPAASIPSYLLGAQGFRASSPCVAIDAFLLATGTIFLAISYRPSLLGMTTNRQRQLNVSRAGMKRVRRDIGPDGSCDGSSNGSDYPKF